MDAAQTLSAAVGIKAACEALNIPRSAFYRQKSQQADGPATVKKHSSPLALDDMERQAVLDLLHSERFCDMAPHQVYAVLLDQGQYLFSIRTMYRILAEAHGEVKERRRQVSRPNYKKPELLATRPNQVWSWDITKLKGQEKYTCFHLYVIIDIFSRYVVGWMAANREQEALARRLIEHSCQKQNISPGQLTIHADRGASMRSKSVAQLLDDLEVTKTHSRPHVSNDNPYSEAQFKTLKYSPAFPDRFGSLQDATSFCRSFLHWYNKEHRHSGIALLTPEQVHYGLDKVILEHRAKVLAHAFHKNPARFKGKTPMPESPPKAVWINKPQTEDTAL